MGEALGETLGPELGAVLGPVLGPVLGQNSRSGAGRHTRTGICRLFMYACSDVRELEDLSTYSIKCKAVRRGDSSSS
jgi:hypothetical protein